MKTKTKECLDTINQIPFVRQNLFVVTIKQQNQLETLFPLNEIEYFHEEKKKRVVIKLRCSLDNLPKIHQMSNMVYKHLPTCLITNKNKFQITLSLLTPDLNESGFIEYCGCVLKNISYPMFFYGKGSDNVATVYFEFKYSKKEFVDNYIPNKGKIKPYYEQTYGITKNPWLKMGQLLEIDNHDYVNMTEEEVVKYIKTLDNSNKMLDDALKTSKKHYEEKGTLEEFDAVEKAIEGAKQHNLKRKRIIESHLKFLAEHPAIKRILEKRNKDNTYS